MRTHDELGSMAGALAIFKKKYYRCNATPRYEQAAHEQRQSQQRKTDMVKSLLTTSKARWAHCRNRVGLIERLKLPAGT